jgi:nitrite reductase (NO-forming)
MVAELTLEAAGQYVLVDHALSRVERGLAAMSREPENPEVFKESAGQQLTMAD